MILRILIPFLLLSSVLFAGNSFKSNVDVKFEAGLFLPDISGDIANTTSTAKFDDDLGFSKATASYFSLGVRLDYDYVPNFYVSYFNMRDKADSTLSNAVTIASASYTGDITSDIAYDTINMIAYQDFVIKGSTKSLFGYRVFTGDIEFDIGLNVKNLNWRYDIATRPTISQESFIQIKEFIFLPYFGFKYYWYNVIVLGDISALSFNEAKATSIQLAVDYRLVDGLYLSAGYLYERVKAVDKSDTITFDTQGYKFSFKYKF